LTRPNSSRATAERDAALIRAYRLNLAAHDGKRVTIEGVTIDLSSRDIDRKLWVTRDGFGYEQWPALGPRLAFPWTSKDYREALIEAGDFVEAASGDTVFVCYAERKQVDRILGGFELEADQEALVADLGVYRRNGEFEFVPFPLVFVRRGATMPPHRPMDEFSALRQSLVERLQALTGIPDIEAAFDPVEDEGWEALPEIKSSAGYDSRLALLALSRAGKDEDALVAFGYHMARALLVEPRVELVRLGGRKSVLARKKPINRRDRHAVRVARRLLETVPELARNHAKLAHRVLDEWYSLGPGPVPEKPTISDAWLGRILKRELAKRE
jgi:hypothetical protein